MMLKIQVMKNIFCCLFGIISGLISAQDSWKTDTYFQTDSAEIYSWNSETEEWILSSIQYYVYSSNGHLQEILVSTQSTEIVTSKSVYDYNDQDQLTTLTSYSWNQTWIPTGRNLMYYNELGQISEIKLQFLESGEWITDRWQKEYEYDTDGKNISYHSIFWRNNTWTLSTISYIFYDEEGKLLKRISYYPNGNIDSQITYEYNENGLKTVDYAQYPSLTGWNNLWLREYYYNKCGKQEFQIRYKGIGTTWVPESKTILFQSFDIGSHPGKKIPICHKGNTIYVSKNSIKAHIAHGDCIGECLYEEQSKNHESFEETGMVENFPFTIYPNPAADKITISVHGDIDYDIKRIEIADLYGRLQKSINVKNDGDLIIYRNGLKSGKYYIRLIGKETFSSVVIFN
jgi:hypothetical protein